MTKVGNIKEGKTPKYDDIVDASFAKKAIAQLGEWKGPVCPTAAFLIAADSYQIGARRRLAVVPAALGSR